MNREEIIKEAQEQVNYHTPLHTEDFIHGYVVGAEPREKRIAELEELLINSKNLSDTIEKAQKKQIAELEKENAELKGIKDVATLIRANNDTVVTLMQLNNMLVSKSQQLTKATELLKKVIKFTWGEGWMYSLDVKVESEQFIKDLEK